PNSPIILSFLRLQPISPLFPYTTLFRSRVAHDCCPRRVEIVALRDLRQKAISAGNIFKSPRPPSSFIPYPAIFDVPRCYTLCGQSRAKMSGMFEVVFCAPEATVDVHNNRKWTAALGQTQLPKLIGIGPVGEAGICRWCREGENVI